MKFTCQYAILQFMPYPETREFANAGVVLMCPERGYFGFKMLKRYGRITQFFGQMDRRIYLQGKRILQDELQRVRTTLKGDLLDMRRRGKDPRDAIRVFAELTRRREAIFRFDMPGVLMAEDPKLACAELYGYFVERDFVTKEYQEQQLERATRRLLLSASLSERFEPATLGDDEYHARFPFVAIRDEVAIRVIKPLFLAQEETNKIYAHADVWLPKVRRLRAKNLLPEAVMFPLTAPPMQLDSKRRNAFEEVKRELELLDVMTAPANDEEAVLEFARGAYSP
jgi:hypothetical protein